jgi:hypothetical protein
MQLGSLDPNSSTSTANPLETRRMAAPLRLASTAECVRFEQDSFGALHQMLAGLSDDARADAWAEIEQAHSDGSSEMAGSRRPASSSSRPARALSPRAAAKSASGTGAGT